MLIGEGRRGREGWVRKRDFPIYLGACGFLLCTTGEDNDKSHTATRWTIITKVFICLFACLFFVLICRASGIVLYYLFFSTSGFALMSVYGYFLI